jgi:acetyl-CoA carboxylase biotin carboxylase subunit
MKRTGDKTTISARGRAKKPAGKTTTKSASRSAARPARSKAAQAGRRKAPRTCFRKVLVANRGEIAVRILRSCRELGIATVAVCSEAERGALHAQLADEVVVIGPPPPLESYLRIDRILDAARQTGAEAIHPGYGFLAENQAFAAACSDAHLVYIGPPASVIAMMGEKTAARSLMEKAGVPVVPGGKLPAPAADGQMAPDQVRAAAKAVGYPLLVKAAFGGGGKGMRLVNSAAEIVDAAAAASREARKAFGDGTVYLEHYLERPRHIEFQVFADNHGQTVHLGERECSIQRRHQKIIEETPSPVMTPELRQRMGEAAVAAARAAGYVNAGTVEFLLAQDGSFYFLEMNTRLQVEHPVTEMVTGLDLVRVQIAVAAGEKLPWNQQQIVSRGHAIECRIYAEDPAHDFRPSLGQILLLREPSGPGIRVDSGVQQGDEVTMYYDPMIAKLIVHGADRRAAIERASCALRSYAVLGPRTNGPYLLAILAHPEFAAGRTHTGFLGEQLGGWPSQPSWPQQPRQETAALVAAAVHEHFQGVGGRGVALWGAGGSGPQRADGPGGEATVAAVGPWQRLGRFRLRGLG